MTPITVSADHDDGDHHITLSGPEGYVCLDDAAARTAGRELVALADAQADGPGLDPDTVAIDRTMLARLLGCAITLRDESDECCYDADDRAIEAAKEALDRR